MYLGGSGPHGTKIMRPALIDEDYGRAPRGRLTTRCYGYSLSDKSDEGQDAALRVEIENTNYLYRYNLDLCLCRLPLGIFCFSLDGLW